MSSSPLNSCFRRWHPRIGLLVAGPLLMTAVTGMLFRIFSFFLDRTSINFLLKIHTGQFLSFPGAGAVYCSLLGICALSMVVTAQPMMIGFWSSRFQCCPSAFSCRVMHRQISSFIFLFLAYSALTGLIYGIVHLGFHSSLDWLRQMHNFDFFTGCSLVYTTLLGISVFTMALSGLIIRCQLCLNASSSSRRSRICRCCCLGKHLEHFSSASPSEFVAVDGDESSDILLERVTSSAPDGSHSNPTDSRYLSVPTESRDPRAVDVLSPASSNDGREDRLLSSST